MKIFFKHYLSVIALAAMSLLLLPEEATAASCKSNPDQDKCCNFTPDTTYCKNRCTADSSNSWCAGLCTTYPSSSWCSGSGTTPTSTTGNMAIETQPMFLSGYADPNIIFTLDDSGSMEWEFMPDGISSYAFLFPMPNNPYSGGTTYSTRIYDFDDTFESNFYLRSSENNKIFYNPSVTYTPWKKADGTSYTESDPLVAYKVPADTGKGSLDLTGTTTQTWNSWRETGGSTSTSKSYWPITYYVYKGTGDKKTRSSYVRHQVRYDAAGTSITFASGKTTKLKKYLDAAEDTTISDADLKTEVQNFANWFSYYRSRILLTRAAISQAFVDLPSNYRVGFAAINYRPSSSVSINGGLYSSSQVMKTGVAPFEGSAKTAFFNDVFTEFSSGSTPLLNAVDQVGQYFGKGYSTLGPWAETVGVSDTEAEADAEVCRRSFNIVMTDGYYNGTAPTTGSTLRDVAKHYFTTDLQTGIGVGQKLDVIDINDDGDTGDYGDNPATRPHMTTLTLGLGVEGTLNTPAVGTDLSTITWPSTPFSDAEKIDDMLRAAAETGGRFFASASATELANSIKAALAVTDPGLASAAAVALNSGALFNGSMLFQAVFDGSDWSGKLDAYLIDSTTGQLPSSPSATFTAPLTNRNIVTYGYDKTAGGSFKGVLFTKTELDKHYLTSAGTTTLTASIETSTTTEANSQTKQENVISWLRGDTTIDTNTALAYRDRTTATNYVSGKAPLGDIIHSAPVYVGAPNAAYSSNWGADTDEYSANVDYEAFKANNCLASQTSCSASSPRNEIVYVGANDGMLHMFHVTTGTTGCLVAPATTGGTCITKASEVGAYIPNAVIAAGDLDELPKEDYSHRYYVDGTVTVGDVFIDADNNGTKEWQTVLVGSLRGGGKGLYAINITDTTLDSNGMLANLKDKVMWEYTHADLGYTYSRPNIVRLQTGEWGVVFGNGYNADDADGDAKLFVIDIETGGQNREVILNTEVGYAERPTAVTHKAAVDYKNGLATAAPIDLDGDHLVDLVYAGDLYGNLWRFDVVDDNNTSKWETSYYGDPVFQVKGPSNEVQPITTRPVVTRHPTAQGGYLIYFGTGKYIEMTDRNIASPEVETHSFYGIWDRDESSLVTFDRSHLLQQSILFERTIQETATGSGLDEFDYRITTNNAMTWYEDEGKVPTNDSSCYTSLPNSGTDCKYLGWYIDLVDTEGLTASPLASDSKYDTMGERQVTDAIVRNNRVIFTTLMPDGTVCSSEDTGWLMELDAVSGSRLPFTPFDVDGDGNFSVADYYVTQTGDPITGKVPVSGRKSTVGILPTPGILSDYSDPTQGREFKYMSGSTGKIEAVTENASASEVGRQSWRQLFRE